MDIIIPELGESITEGTISSWMKKVGDVVKNGDLLLELETDKVNLEITAQSDGVLDKINKQSGETVKVGETVGTIAATAAHEVERGKATVSEMPIKNESKEKKPAASSDHTPDKAFTASPSLRKLAREKGIDLNSQRTPEPIATNQDNVDSARPIERQRMSRRRLTIAKRLVEAQRTAAMLTTFSEVDMTAILDIRKRRKQAFQEKHEVGLGFMSFFVKAVVGGLKSFPLLNAEIDKEEIVIKQYYDIGIAVAAKEGLVVPVVRGVDRLSFAEIERRVSELADKARSNSLALTDLQGGTFTITNGGVFGSLFSTPILNAPQVGILGMHTIQKRPMAMDDDRIENRPMMYIALSYDHRIVDGSDAVRFLGTVKELIRPNFHIVPDRVQ
ncbi:MAG: dihydrolipoamide succinyltransferase [Bacilli bacterium]|nr:dihydrolipoamide succinyltransferase [Bacilli bacterium]